MKASEFLGLLIVSLAVATLVGCASPSSDSSSESYEPVSPSGDYLDNQLPSDRAELFAEPWISGPRGERDFAISPDGNRVLYTLVSGRDGTLLEWVREGDGWNGPRVASFSGQSTDIEPAFHPDGPRLAFASRRPLPGETGDGDWNLWEVSFDGSSWGRPQPIDGINTDSNEFYPSYTRDGSILFTARREGGIGDEDLWFSAATPDGFAAAVALDANVNSPGSEFNAFIDPDRKYVLFSSVREGDLGGGDLYVSFGDGDGGWLPAIALGPNVNTSRLDYCPFVSPDGRYLIFTSNRTIDRPADGWTYDALDRMLDGPNNGADSLYWVAMSAVEDLRPQVGADNDAGGINGNGNGNGN